MSSLKLLETTAFISTKLVLLKKKRNGYCFIYNVTMVDIIRYNLMFVKLFVPCKLMNQTILGFQSAFVSENVFASIKMYHQRSYICFFFFYGWFYNLYKVRLSKWYIQIVYFQHRFNYMKFPLITLYHQKHKVFGFLNQLSH